jgi:hypothetical protein
MQKRFWYIVGCLVLLLAGGGGWFFFNVGEKGKPVVEIGADASVIGLRKDLTVTFSDSGRGPPSTTRKRASAARRFRLPWMPPP